MTYKLLALIAVSISIPAQADQPEWTVIATDTTGTVVSARTSDLMAGRSDQTSAKMWLEYDASRNTTVGWRRGIMLFVVNCPAETYRIASKSLYYPDGRHISSHAVEPAAFAVPGTILSAAIAALCADLTAPVTYR